MGAQFDGWAGLGVGRSYAMNPGSRRAPLAILRSAVAPSVANPAEDARMGLTTQWSQIERLQGDAATEAWQWFIDRYRGFVIAALRRLIWSSDRAVAACDEFWGYLFASGAVGRLQRSMRFRAFLVTLLRNYAQGWMRRNPRVPAAADVDDRPGADGWLPEDEEVALWAHQLLHLAIRRLERDQPRQAEALRAFYGLAPSADGEPPAPRRASDLAEVLGCSANALHQLLFRARAHLRDCVVEEVRQTVRTTQDLEAELEVLVAALARATPGIVGPWPNGGQP